MAAVVLSGALSGVTEISVTAAAAIAIRPLPAGVPVAVAAVAFPDANSGWALGTDGGATRIWHTGTAGVAWRAQWRGSGTPLAITASDPAHAWALTGCAKPCGSRLLGTTDGGARWRVLVTWPASDPVDRVRFVTPRLGVATSGGQLLVSHDGGARWSRSLSVAAPVFGTVAASGQLWAAETVLAGRTAPGIRFVTSTDGGRTWRRLSQLGGSWPLSPSVRVTLAVTGGKLAWASVFDPLSCAMHGCAVANVLSSPDGGRTWHPAHMPDGAPDECGTASVALSAAPGGAVWAALGRNGAACAPPIGQVYLGAAGALGQERTPWQLTTVSSLTAVSGQVAYAIGDQGELSRTRDGGRTWTQVLPSAVPVGTLAAVPLSGDLVFGAQDGNDAGAVLRGAPGGGWQQVADLPGVVTQLGFSSATTGFALSYTPGFRPAWRLWTTSDGGGSWTRPGSLPPTSGVIEGPWLTADGHGLLLTVASGTPWQPGSGGTGAVREWTTVNGGATWTGGGGVPLGRDTLDGSASFWYSPSGGWTGWLPVANTSETQQVMSLSDGRLTVLSGQPPADDVQLIGPGSGFAWGVSYPGRSSSLVLFRTSDNGRTWQHVSVGLPASDDAAPLMGFASLDDGWLILGGTTWHTTDAGHTWRIA